MPATNVYGIKVEISKLSHMRDLPIERFTTEEGYAAIMAREFDKKLKATQLRKFFGLIKAAYRQSRLKHQVELEPALRAKLMLVMPTLAYAKARNLIPVDFYEILRDCMSTTRLQNAEDLERLSQFMEALVAYHKE